MKKFQILMLLLSAVFMQFGITHVNAQDMPTFLKTDNQFVQQRIEKSDPAGWLYFNPSAKIGNGEMFKFHKLNMGLSSNDSMHLVETSQDEQGFTHNRYQQYFKNIKVEDADFFEHSRDCYVQIMHGKIMENLSIGTLPGLSEQQALNGVLEYLGATQYAWENPSWEQHLKEDLENPNATYYPVGSLVLAYPFGEAQITNNYTLAWKYEILALTPAVHKIVYINANTGEIFKAYDVGERNGPAVTLYDGIETIDTRWVGGIFHYHHHLESNDGGKKINTRVGSTFTFNQAGAVIPQEWTGLKIATDSDDDWAIDVSNETTAHWAVNRAWDYFKFNFGRNGMNNNYGEVRVFGNAADIGAFFHPVGGKDHLVFGREFTSTGFTTNLATLDISGHEYTHGIISYEAKFNPFSEPGAISESFCDIFGTMVENFQRGGAINWTIGEDVVTYRDMENPAVFGHPSTYGTSDPFWINVNGCTPVPGNPPFGNDLCGIHINCGVQNRWFYLLTQGGSQNGISVQGIGASSAANIAFSNLCNFLGSSTSFTDARLGAIAAARLIYGSCSNEEIQTTNAWAAVGVGAIFQGPCIYVSGPNEICVERGAVFKANGMPGAVFSWSFPSNWTTQTTGTGNNKLIITDIPSYPTYPVLETISVTSSLGGTTSITIEIVDDCLQKCTDGEIGAREQRSSRLEENNPEIMISPNPSKNRLVVQSNGNKIRLVKVFNLTGELVYENSKVKDYDTTIDLMSLKAGTYFLQVQLDGNTITKRFIKVE